VAHSLCVAEVDYRPSYLFAADSISLSSFTVSLGIQSKIVRYGRSRSFKVIEISTNRKPVCEFLKSSNVMCVLLSFPKYNDSLV